MIKTIASCFFLMSSFLGMTQLDIETEKKENPDSKNGLYVKKGQMKLNVIECYDFDDMMVAFDLYDNYFAFDGIKIEIGIAHKDEQYEERYSDYYSKAEIAKFAGKEYAYFPVVEMVSGEEKSYFWSTNRYRLNRVAMQQTSKKKNVENSELRIHIKGGTITGQRTVHERQADGSVISRSEDVWSWTELDLFKVAMKNRKKILPVSLGLKTKPDGDGNCYK